MPPEVPVHASPVAMPDDHFGAALIEQTAALSAYARRLTAGGADADDLLQDTLLRCWSARASFAAGTSLIAWARTVMKNNFLTGRRRARFQADLPEEARDRMLKVDETQSLAIWLRDTDWALGELPPHQREAVLLASQGASIEAARRYHRNGQKSHSAGPHSAARAHRGAIDAAVGGQRRPGRGRTSGRSVCQTEKEETGLAGRKDRITLFVDMGEGGGSLKILGDKDMTT